MLTSLYSAAAGMDASTARHEVTSRNLAHMQHPGYRRLLVRQHDFREALQAQESPESGSPGVAQGLEIYTDFTPGPMDTTGRKLDVAIQGEGFFAVQGPNGPLYTRNGAFQLNENGELVTADGLLVEGKGGSLTIPATASVETLSIGADGSLSVDGQQIGALEVVRFADPQRLEAAGVSLYGAPPDMPAEPVDAVVVQGARERSNVSAIDELVSLIAASRHYEAAQRALQTVSQSVERHTNLQGGN
jgi:flagellar basal-body rod protein FlgF